MVFICEIEVITSKVLRSPPCLGWLLWNICVTNDHRYVPLVVSTSRSFPHLWLITGFVTRVTRRVPLVEQELLTLPEHLSSPLFLVGFVLLDLLFYMCVFCCCLSFVLFLLIIVLSVLLWYKDSDYPFGIFKLFLQQMGKSNSRLRNYKLRMSFKNFKIISGRKTNLPINIL